MSATLPYITSCMMVHQSDSFMINWKLQVLFYLQSKRNIDIDIWCHGQKQYIIDFNLFFSIADGNTLLSITQTFEDIYLLECRR